MTLTTQFLTMLTMIGGGIYLGAAVDTMKRFEKNYRKHVLMNYVIVISFWLLQVLILFYLLYQTNYGELRLYVFLAVLCGFAAYKGLFQQSYRKLLERLIRISLWISTMIKKCFRTFVFKPIIGLWKLLQSIVIWVLTVLLAGILLLLRIVWWPFRLILGLIWRLVPQNIKNYLFAGAGFYDKIKNIIKKWWKKFQK
ncbi:spore cortex biosynthesis protein YabQ [Thalassobacillus hwangdonensis]|uniref:Spore cortex biosynthesis protein YabQ n=1 Tax=Thalassobacillus hwangdonensis TaxID=546108 RepID=A0ABW3L6L5_9BACI